VRLVGVGNTSHTRHHAEHVVVHGVDADLGGSRAGNSARREHELEHSVVNAREVARTAGLVLFGAKGKAVHVDTAIGVAGVVLEGLDNVEVGALALREAVLAVKLELGRDDGVLTPAVEVKSGLGEHEGAGIGDTRATRGDGVREEGGLGSATRLPVVGSGGLADSAGHVEKAGGVDVAVGAADVLGATKSVDGLGKSIDGVRVVEGLGTERAEKHGGGVKGRAVIDVSVGLNNPDKLLAGVVEVELDLVGGRADRLITSELELLDEVLVGVLGHLAALVRVEEDVVDVEGGSNKGLLVGSGGADGARGGRKGGDGPEALTNGAEVNVDLDLVVLESDEGKGKAGVAAEPELKGNVKGGLRKGLARSANLGRAAGGSAGARDGGEVGVADVRKSRGVTNHLEVTALLLSRERELVPDVHPVTVLAVNALATNLDLNLGDDLLTNVAEPAGPHGGVGAGSHVLVDLGENKLEVGAVAQIAVAADRAGHAATEIGLAREGLLNGLHGEVRVAAVRHLPESNLGGTREEHVLGTVSDKLHKSSTHPAIAGIYYAEKIIFGELLN